MDREFLFSLMKKLLEKRFKQLDLDIYISYDKDYSGFTFYTKKTELFTIWIFEYKDDFILF